MIHNLLPWLYTTVFVNVGVMLLPVGSQLPLPVKLSLSHLTDCCRSHWRCCVCIYSIHYGQRT